MRRPVRAPRGTLRRLTSAAKSSARAETFNHEVLLHDARALLASAAARLFTVEEIAGLRRLSDENDDASRLDRLLTTRAPLQVTINPEARVSVVRTTAPPPRMTCGGAAPWLVRIVNQGRVGSALNATLVGDVAGPVRLQQTIERLAGAAVEYRVLTMTVATTKPIDVTLAFDVGRGTDDLALRSQLSLLVRCAL